MFKKLEKRLSILSKELEDIFKLTQIELSVMRTTVF